MKWLLRRVVFDRGVLYKDRLRDHLHSIRTGNIQDKPEDAPSEQKRSKTLLSILSAKEMLLWPAITSALLYKDCSLDTFCCETLHHAGKPYKMTANNMELTTCKNWTSGIRQSNLSLLSKNSNDFPFLAALFVCWDHLRSEEMVRPNNSELSTRSRALFKTTPGGILGAHLQFVTSISLVLLGFKTITLVVHHFTMLSISSWKVSAWPSLTNTLSVWSSAYLMRLALSPNGFRL